MTPSNMSGGVGGNGRGVREYYEMVEKDAYAGALSFKDAAQQRPPPLPNQAKKSFFKVVYSNSFRPCFRGFTLKSLIIV